MTPSSTSFRIPDITTQQLADLAKALGCTQTQVLVMAIDRMAREELKKKK